MRSIVLLNLAALSKEIHFLLLPSQLGVHIGELYRGGSGVSGMVRSRVLGLGSRKVGQGEGEGGGGREERRW